MTGLSGFLWGRVMAKSIILITFVFCAENDVSDQTVESYKSKSNEDSPGHEKNGHGMKL